MHNILSLVLTFGVGLFILLGTSISFLAINNKKFLKFSMSLAFGVIISLIGLDLIPEACEMLDEKENTFFLILLVVLIGIVLVKTLDYFVPNHNHDHDSKKDLKNLYHISLISSLALILHNVIEGMALYGTSIVSLKTGILLCIGIGLHNIPLGIVIATTFYEANKNKKKTLLISLIVSLSSFIGGFLMFVLKDNILTPTKLGILICITIGMLIYISMFELAPKLFCKKDFKVDIKLKLLGIISGFVILFISSLF